MYQKPTQMRGGVDAVILLLLGRKVVQILLLHLAKFCRFTGQFFPACGYLNQRLLNLCELIFDPVREQLPAVDLTIKHLSH